MKIMSKPTALLLVLIIAFSAMGITAVAEGGLAVEEREPFFCKKEDCIVELETDRINRGDSVRMTAKGCYIDIFETDTAPVEGDIRFIPVKWRARLIENDKIIDSGEWTELQTSQTDIVKTGNVFFINDKESVDVGVEVDFIRQEYKNGKWETVGGHSDSNRFTLKLITENMQNAMNKLRMIIIMPVLPFFEFVDFISFLRLINWSALFTPVNLQLAFARYIEHIKLIFGY